jgi:molybdopterin-guanine dinucleotide biosynthesis protein A
MIGACAFVLAGGRSSRMGQDKAFLLFGGRTLLDRALATAQAAVPQVRIVGSSEKFENFDETVEDQFPNHGPLAGIHAALRASDCDYNLILAVDMPFVESDWLVYLLEQARTSQATVTLSRGDGAWQPLCAVYRREFADLAEPALQAGCNRIDALFPQAKLRIIGAEELTSRGFSPEMFRNLNTPEEFERAALVKGG